jgi:hypothetical protein
MKIRKAFILIIASFAAFAAQGCSTSRPAGNTATGSSTSTPSALPDNAFKAEVSVRDAPAKLQAGQKATLQVKVKNASGVQWYARGAETNTDPDNKFHLSVGDRWLDANEVLITDMDGRYGLPQDLKPGEETEVPLLITAPKDPGDYILELDVLQEQVVWFHDKGSPMARAKIKVER